MEKKKGSIWRVFLLGVIAISVFGFRSGSNPERELYQDDEIAGYIFFTIQARTDSHTANDDSVFTWHAVSELLPVVYGDFYGRERYWVFGKTLYTVLESHSRVGVPRIGTATMVIPVAWHVTANIKPDCSVDFFVDESWYPGNTVTCAPIVGCMFDMTAPNYFRHSGTVTIPAGEGIGTIPWMGSNFVNGRLTIMLEILEVGEEEFGCSYTLESSDDLISPAPDND